MLTILEKQQSDLLHVLSDHVRAKYSQHEAEIIMQFIRRCCASVALEDLRTRSIDDLLYVLLSLWHHIQVRSPGQLKVRVYNPEYKRDGWQSTHTMVEISNDDMPFLVDSVRSTINDQNVLVNLMMYTGGMQIRRDESFKIIDVLSDEAQIVKVSTEAPIHVELDRKLNADKIEKLQTALEKSLQDNIKAVNDWLPMKKHVQLAKQWLTPRADGKFQQEINEACDFLEWMLSENFIFLGVRDYHVLQDNCKYELVPIKDSGLGILRDTDQCELPCHFLDPASKAFQLAISPRPIVLVKTDIQSNVRRRDYMDCVIVKKWNAEGKVIGERHFVGLYTSVTYRTDPAQVPILRFKMQQILERSQLPSRRSYAWRAIRNILEDLPRDDLLQGARSELLELSKGILHLQERQRVRLFVREDVFKRFYSCLVYVPRDHFNTELRQKIGQILKEELKGISITFATTFSKSVLARIHFMVSVDPEELRQPDFVAIEKRLIMVTRSWYDDFLNALMACYGEDKAFHYAARYRQAFPAGYKEQFSARSAVFDVRYMENLTADNPLEINIYQDKKIFHFKLFRCNHHLPLSDVLPMFENLGLRVLDECPHKITFPNGNIVWINDFEVTGGIVQNVDIALNENNVKEVFKAVWDGRAESDRFNQLILVSGVTWREVMMLRAHARYLKQIGVAYSQTYIAETLIANAAITKQLVALFHVCFDPALARDINESKCIENQIAHALNDVKSLDKDKIIRRYLNLLHATLRTNFYQKTETGVAKKYFSFKFDSHKIAELPEPWPRYEVFVYSPEFEGIHLRAAKVARGGVRWSDRREDFRTEVLGLMKAQQVKNSLIIPQGAKGGFVVKCLLPTDERQVRRDKGIACYKDFIRGLLDITDNLKGQQVVMPNSVVRYDDDDSYLVVAADKGTADFSDIANQVSQEYHFWLDDAFASGGKAGYDHKRMGITARGVWESVKRHFCTLNQDIENHDFTVVGIGDMAGDVFGNGMLLSKHIQLIAAFNHMHIFIDPHPNAAISFGERQRLFALPHSAWSDYNPQLISSGGGVFSRAEKSITVSSEMKKIFNLSKDVITPNELIQSILKANVDLLYNGGIGTFIKAASETHQDAEDRHNDAIRIDADALRCKVIAEGGNLGLTQLARVEFSLQGGLVYRSEERR